MEYTVNCTYTPIVLKGFRPLQWLKETVHMGEKRKNYQVLVQKTWSENIT